MGSSLTGITSVFQQGFGALGSLDSSGLPGLDDLQGLMGQASTAIQSFMGGGGGDFSMDDVTGALDTASQMIGSGGGASSGDASADSQSADDDNAEDFVKQMQQLAGKISESVNNLMGGFMQPMASSSATPKASNDDTHSKGVNVNNADMLDSVGDLASEAPELLEVAAIAL